MKKLIIATTALIIASTAPAIAGGYGHNNGGSSATGGNGRHGGHGGAGGAGGDATAGAIAGSESRAGATANSFVNAGSSTTTSINSTYDAAAYAPDVIANECQIGLSAGIPGKHCRVLVEAELIEYYWGRNAAAQHLVDNNKRIRKTVERATAAPTKVSSRNRARNTRVTVMRGENR